MRGDAADLTATGSRIGATAADARAHLTRFARRLAYPTAILLAPLLLVQAKRAASGLEWLPEPGGRRWGVAGAADSAAPPLRLIAVGDSTSTGVGADRLEHGLVVQTAMRLAELLDRRVEWRIQGLEGSTSAQVLRDHAAQVDGRWDVLLVLVGANDTLKLVHFFRFRRAVRGIVDLLREHRTPTGFVALVGVPHVRVLRWLPQPMRGLLGAHAMGLNDALAEIAVRKPDVVHVATPLPEAQAVGQFARDGFHPSPLGYRAWAAAIAPRLATEVRRRAR